MKITYYRFNLITYYMKRRQILSLLTFAAVVMLVIAACSKTPPKKPSLAVSIAPQKYLLEQIVGDKYDIVTLLPANSNPETYDPSVNSIMGMQKSLIFFRIGTIGFEQASIGKIAENLPELKIVNSGAGIPLAEGTHQGPRGYDPHVWSSVKNARIIARNMYDALVKNIPKDEKYFTRRYRVLDRDLAQLDSTLAAELASSRGAAFVIQHPSLTYFANDYGLRQMPLEINGKEPSASQMRTRLDEISTASPRVFFLEKGHKGSQTESLARDLNIPTAEISLLDYDWKKNLLTVARAIATHPDTTARKGN